MWRLVFRHRTRSWHGKRACTNDEKEPAFNLFEAEDEEDFDFEDDFLDEEEAV